MVEKCSQVKPKVLVRKMLGYSWPILVLGIAGILNQTADKDSLPAIYEKGDAHTARNLRCRIEDCDDHGNDYPGFSAMPTNLSFRQRQRTGQPPDLCFGDGSISSSSPSWLSWWWCRLSGCIAPPSSVATTGMVWKVVRYRNGCRNLMGYISTSVSGTSSSARPSGGYFGHRFCGASAVPVYDLSLCTRPVSLDMERPCFSLLLCGSEGILSTVSR